NARRGAGRSGGKAGGRGRDGGGSQRDPLDEPVHGLAELGIFLEEGLDLVDRVQDGRVVLAAEGAADLGERGVGELTREVHRDLPREGDGPRPVLRLEVGELYAEELGDASLDLL